MLELTGLELDAAGSARAIRALQAELQRRPDLELVALAQPRPRRGKQAGRIWRGLQRELLYLPLQLSRRARAAGAQVLHCPLGVAPLRSSLPMIVTVNDLMALEHPEWFTRANSLQQRTLLPRALRRATLVLCPSSHTGQRLVELCGLDPARIEVIPYGVGPPFRPGPPASATLDRLDVSPPYVLSVGTLQPRKNLERTLRAFERISIAGAPHALVVVGARGWRDEGILEALEGSAARERIRFLGRVSDEELVHLYRGAECLVFASLYEGFGFPVLEAMACGTPVLCANRTSLPELAGDAAELVDPEDQGALESALADLLSSADKRRMLSEAGLARASKFSWDRCGSRTVAAYERAREMA